MCSMQKDGLLHSLPAIATDQMEVRTCLFRSSGRFKTCISHAEVIASVNVYSTGINDYKQQSLHHCARAGLFRRSGSSSVCDKCDTREL